MAHLRRVVAVGRPHHITPREEFRHNVFFDDQVVFSKCFAVKR